MSVYIQGEISNITYHQKSGHIYFTIKDEKVDSSIRCVMYRGNARYLKFKLEKGLKIYLQGSINLYPPRGDYQIISETINVIGEGNLHLAFEQLKKELKDKGYFDSSHKKSIPKFLNKIIILTSASGAVIEDIKKVANKRWNISKLYLINTVVQGENASKNIVHNIQNADKLNADLIILARGGGSLEDLWCFNSKEVVESIFNANTPIVSAIGHEGDYTLSDYVSDLRAPTPSACMEIVLPDKNNLLDFVSECFDNYENKMKSILDNKTTKYNHKLDMLQNNKIEIVLNHLKDKIDNEIEKASQKVKQKLQTKSHYIINTNNALNDTIKTKLSIQENTDNMKNLMDIIIHNKIHSCHESVITLRQLYTHNNPKEKPKKGQANISKQGKSVVLSKIDVNENFTLSDSTSTIEAKAIKKINQKLSSKHSHTPF